MGRDFNAKLSFAIQIKFQSFLDQLDEDNMNKIEELFLENKIKLPNNFTYDDDIYDMLKEVTDEKEKIEKFKEMLNNLEKKDENILIFCSDDLLSCNLFNSYDSYDTMTLEAFENKKQLFERVCYNYGLVYDVTLVLALNLHEW